MKNSVEQMKWWGWGAEHTRFDISDKPELLPFIKKVVGVTDEFEFTPPVRIDDIVLPEHNVNRKFLDVMKSTLREDQIRTDKKERLIHAYGKSFRDLWRIRHGIVEAAPDCVIYPESEDEVSSLVRAVTEYDVILIPFGGGGDIV